MVPNGEKGTKCLRFGQMAAWDNSYASSSSSYLFLVRASAWLNTRSRAPVCLPVPDDLKNEDDLKIEDDLKNEDNLKSEEDLKKLTVLVFRLYPVSLGDALTSAAMRPYFLFNLPLFWYKIF